MQKFIACILLVALLGQTFNQGWYYVSYLVQKKEYMKRCENKARPQMHCNGKCQMMKKIRAQQEKERGQVPELKLAAKAEVAPPTTDLPIIHCHDKTSTTTTFRHTIGAPIDRSTTFFHPPNQA